MKLKKMISMAILLAAAIAICSDSARGARPAEPLKPDQVLVVANANSPASSELAAFYASKRGIAKRNIVLLKTPETYTVSRKDYQATISRPIAQAMLERRLDKHIRSICLIWGVPVRIAEQPAPEMTPAEKTEVFYKAQAKESLARMSVCHELLARVGKPLSDPPTLPADRIENVADLFAKPLPAPPSKTPQAKDLFEQLARSIVRKQINVRSMKDKTAKLLAERQLMAVQRELYGLKGLMGYITDTRITNPPDIKALKAAVVKIENSLARLGRTGSAKSLDNARLTIELLRRSGGLRLVVGYVAGRDASTGKSAKHRKANKQLMKTTASVDSELAMLWRSEYKIQGPAVNPLHWKSRAPAAVKGRRAALMTARIDAPSAALARRVIIDSIAVEKAGLKGVFYIDAGLTLKFLTASNNAGYRAYDDRLNALHSFLTRYSDIKAVIDNSSELFASGKCPNAALYAGWYSLRKYVPAFTWNTGAVGWHTASFEAADLRNAKSRQWCPQMLARGVAATVGAVDEPFLMAFPAPEEFYPLLLTGKYTIAECYWRTVPNASWQMTLIADPLYNPFKTNPKVLLKHLPATLTP